MPIPKAFLTAAEFTLNLDIKRAFDNDEANVERARNAANELVKWRLELDRVDVEFALRRALEATADEIGERALRMSPRWQNFKRWSLSSPPCRSKSTSGVFRTSISEWQRPPTPGFSGRAFAGDEEETGWMEHFRISGRGLSFNVDAVLG